jgi:hypothetical protein
MVNGGGDGKGGRLETVLPMPAATCYTGTVCHYSTGRVILYLSYYLYGVFRDRYNI